MECNEKRREQLSALVDGELSGKLSEAVEGLLRDEESKALWRRYHLIGDSLRGDLQPRRRIDVARPGAGGAPAIGVSRKSLSARAKSPVAFALAATFVICAALALFQRAQVDAPGTIEGVFVAQSPSLGPSSGPSSGPYPEEPAVAQSEQFVSPQLSKYLASYSQHRANMGVAGLPPHARMIANQTFISD